MSTAELRTSIENLLDKINDEKLLKAYYTLLNNTVKDQEKEEIVGHTVTGVPLTKKKLIKKVKAASARVKAGKYVSQKQLEKEIENW